jgi:methylase of polypeptide subunit release factors
VCSAIRVSSLGQDLLIHSRWPTHDADSVFLGPDTYRFAAFIEQAIGAMPPGSSIVDVGAGSGAGGIVASRLTPSARLMLCDTNRRARAFARANLEAADLPGEVVESDGLDAVSGEVDLIVANPPFMAGRSGLTYCDGGDLHGAALSLDWCEAAFSRLAPGGRMLLYTGATIIEGRDEFRTALQSALEAAPQRDRLVMTYREIDPDIFGSELARAAYADAERIAAVGVQIQRLR